MGSTIERISNGCKIERPIENTNTMRLLPFIFNLIIGTFAAKKYTSDDEDLYGGSGDFGSGDVEEGSGGSWDSPDTAEVDILDITWLIIGAGALTAVIVICSIIYCCCIKKKDDTYHPGN